MFNFNIKKHISEVLRQTSFDWNALIEKVRIITTKKEEYFVDGKDIIWDHVPQYTSCQILDVSDYFDLDTHTPLQIFINIAKVEDFGVQFHFEDRNTGLKRKQKSNMLAYNGPKFHNYILDEPMKLRAIFKLFETIHSEDDEAKNCKNYPNQDAESYEECDQKFLYSQFKNLYKIMPIWVTDNFEQVTKLM